MDSSAGLLDEFVGGVVAKCSSSAVSNDLGHVVKFLLRNGVEVGSLGEEAAYLSVGALVAPALTRGVWEGEVDLGAPLHGQVFVLCYADGVLGDAERGWESTGHDRSCRCRAFPRLGGHSSRRSASDQVRSNDESW